MSPDTGLDPPHRKTMRASPNTCAACRARKVRCDGHRSVCSNCERLGFTCSFENPQSNAARSSVVTISRRRAHLACLSCHSRKVHCNEERPSCRRCSRLGISCVYPVPGRAPDLAVSGSDTTLFPDPLSPDSSSGPQTIQVRARYPRESDGTVHDQRSKRTAYRPNTETSASPQPQELESITDASGSPLLGTLNYDATEMSGSCKPSEQLAIEALSIFFTRLRHIPVFSFLHRALVMDQYQDGKLHESLLLSIIGVVSLYHDLGPGMTERGDEFIAKAEALVLRDLESPSVPNVQALIFIIKHRAYRRRFTSAFALMAIAIRFAMGLRLNYDDPKLDFLTQECCRRTMWSLYLIDTVMSAGYQEFTLSPSRLLHIQLPTHDSKFDLGVHEEGDYLESPHYSRINNPPSTLNLVIRMMHIRYRVLEFTKQAVVSNVSMSGFGSQVDIFQSELNNYQSQLPPQFQSSTRNIQLHTHSPSLSSFLSIQVHWYMAQCNMYRLFMEGLVEALPRPALNLLDQDFVRACQIRCYKSAISLADVLQTVLSMRPNEVSLDLDIAVCIYQCCRILTHANYTLRIIPDDMAEAVKANCQTCIEFLESMFFECEAVIAIKEDAYKLMATAAMVNISERPVMTTPSSNEESGPPPDSETRHHVFSQHSLVGQVKVPNKDSNLVTSQSFAKPDAHYVQTRYFSPNLSPDSGGTVGNATSSGVNLVGLLSHETFDFNMLEFNLDSSILFS